LAASLADAWQVVYEVALRAGGDPGFPGLIGPSSPPPPTRPRRVALLETEGWASASPDARAALQAACARLRASDIAVVTRADDAGVSAFEESVAAGLALARRINAYESRWPLNTYSA